MFGNYGLFFNFNVTFLVTFSLISSLFLSSPVEGSRPFPTISTQVDSSSTPPLQLSGKEEKTMVLKGQMGSKPPRCTGRCRSCGHCEAIQVPTNPHISRSPVTAINTAYARGGSDNYSDYKPMSWKCKCGSSIFNP